MRRPEGAYYLLVSLENWGAQSGTAAAELLLDRCGIGTVPIEAFRLSAQEQPLVRACFSLPDDELHLVEERLNRL